jgi:hypothetical protein
MRHSQIAVILVDLTIADIMNGALSPQSHLFPPDRHLARRPPSEAFVKRPALPGRMKDRIAHAEFAGPFFGQRHQPLGQSRAPMLRLDEDVEDVSAAMVGRMARMRRPVDHHHAEAPRSRPLRLRASSRNSCRHRVAVQAIARKPRSSAARLRACGRTRRTSARGARKSV